MIVATPSKRERREGIRCKEIVAPNKPNPIEMREEKKNISHWNQSVTQSTIFCLL